MAVALPAIPAQRFGRYEIMETRTLTTEGSYQRPISPWRVRDIVTNYKPILFQPLIIGLRRDKRYIVDGQHRHAAATELGFREVPCMLYDTSSIAEEAEAFVWLQQFRRRMTTGQMFIARIAYNDVAATAIADSLKKYKFEIGDLDGFRVHSGDKHDNVIVAISALEKAYDEGGIRRVEQILYVLRNAWDGRHAALERGIIKGLHQFFRGNVANRDALASKLHDLAPYNLKLAAMSVGHQYGYPENVAIARVIQNIYNDKRPTAKPVAGE